MAFGPKRAVVVAVAPGGPGEAAGLQPGDEILEVDGVEPTDLMDLLDRAGWGRTPIRVRRGQAEFESVLEKDEEESLGLEFSDTLFNRVKTCRNKCVFCFMDQMPKKMRPSLYYRDDDYRLSNLHGNFITLTNLSPEEWNRIRDQRVSPLYVSVHATDNELRELLLGSTRQARMDVMGALRQLADWGLEIHTQIVLMPGLNDGAALEQSLEDLCSLIPSVATISVVPVGLTRYRAHLPGLRPVTPEMVGPLLEQVGRFQTRNLQRYGHPVVYMADEMYLIAGLPMPPHHHYEDYSQLENGVGMVRRFQVDFNRRRRFFPRRLTHPRRYLIVTGEYGGQIFPPLLQQLEVVGLDLKLKVVSNEFFGPLVRCSGLLAGRDVWQALQSERDYLDHPGAAVLIPGVALKDAAVVGGVSGSGLFLDDVSMQAIADRLGVPLVNAGTRCAEWLDCMFERVPWEAARPNRENPAPLDIIAYPEHQVVIR